MTPSMTLSFRTACLALALATSATAQTPPAAKGSPAPLPPGVLSQGSTFGQYAKPGAPIEFRHSVSRGGADSVEVELDLFEAQGDGILAVTLSVPDGVEVDGPLRRTFNLAAGERHTVRFRARADAPGLRHIGVFAELQSPGTAPGEAPTLDTLAFGTGETVRTYAVPVAIGGSTAPMAAPMGKLQAGTDGQVVSMQAAETVNGEPVPAE